MQIDFTVKIPLSFWDDDTIRVKNTRLLIDMIIGAHNRGETPESILDSFPSDIYNLVDIYLIIGFYLNNKAKFDEYLEAREKEAEVIWSKITSAPGYKERHDELVQNIKERWEKLK